MALYFVMNLFLGYSIIPATSITQPSPKNYVSATEPEQKAINPLTCKHTER